MFLSIRKTNFCEHETIFPAGWENNFPEGHEGEISRLH